MLLFGLEMPSKLLHSTQADLVSNTMPTKDFKLVKEMLPAMLLEIMMVPLLFSAPFITMTPIRK